MQILILTDLKRTMFFLCEEHFNNLIITMKTEKVMDLKGYSWNHICQLKSVFKECV